MNKTFRVDPQRFSSGIVRAQSLTLHKHAWSMHIKKGKNSIMSLSSLPLFSLFSFLFSYERLYAKNFKKSVKIKMQCF